MLKREAVQALAIVPDLPAGDGFAALQQLESGQCDFALVTAQGVLQAGIPVCSRLPLRRMKNLCLCYLCLCY